MPGFKAAKEMLMLLLGAKAASNATNPVNFCSIPKARMTTALSEDCFMNSFILKVQKLCRRNDIQCRILLVTDSALGYPTYEVRSSSKVSDFFSHTIIIQKI
jgi:hypothetical protein